MPSTDSPSNHHFITILDFCSLSMNNPQTAMYSDRAKEQVYCTAVNIRPDVNLSPACDVRSASVFVTLPSYPLMSLATVMTPSFILRFLKLCFGLKVFPYSICPRDDAMSKISQMLMFRIFNSSK